MRYIVKLFIIFSLCFPFFSMANKYTEDYNDSFIGEYNPKGDSSFLLYSGIALFILYCFWGFRTPFKNPYSKKALAIGGVASLVTTWLIFSDHSPVASLSYSGLLTVIAFFLPFVVSLINDYLKKKTNTPSP